MRYCLLFIAFAFVLIACDQAVPKLTEQVNTEQLPDDKIVFKLSKDQTLDSWKIERLDNSDFVFTDEFLDKLKESFEACPYCYNINDDSLREKTLEISINNISSDYFDLSDMNFDGSFDISFTSGGTCCNGKNMLKEVWIFDKETKQFNYDSELSSSCIWDYNKEEKTIVTGWSLGYQEYSSTTYKNIDGKMTEISREIMEPVNDSVVRKITEKIENHVWISDTTYENQ